MAAVVLFTTMALSTQAQVKVYPYRMLPSHHPDYNRYAVKSPGPELFGGKTEFTSLRNMSGEFKKNLRLWVDRDQLGNVLWPHYPMIYQDNLGEIVNEINRRHLYLFDLWGYVPGSGPGEWQQFKVPQKSLDLFTSRLGDRWLGMDIGEQDGRYVSSFASRVLPSGQYRKAQYLNFHNHFERMGDYLGNRLSTLVSLNFGHYLIKDGTYCLIGAETAQGLPSAQVYYSYIRGAGKQYGVSWFGNVSVWNRWGWKTYDPKQINDDDNDYDAGSPLKGTSLSLLKRIMYSHFFYNSVLVGFEGSIYAGGETLSPIGRIQQNARKWIARNEPLGVMHTPVALLNDFFSGWVFPRHLYSREAYRVWGNLPYNAQDYFTSDVLGTLYPGYEDASYYHDERGFVAPTPFGDIADCLLSDAPLWVMKQYPLIVVAGEVDGSEELKDKLEAYIREGGHLIITAGSLRNFPEGLSTLKTSDEGQSTSGRVSMGNTSYDEAYSYTLYTVSGKDLQALATNGSKPAIVERKVGNGTITAICSPFGIADKALVDHVKVQTDAPLPNPYPLLAHVKAYLQSQFALQALFTAGDSLSVVTCVKSANEFTLLVSNSNWHEQPLHITSNCGKITSIKEIPIPGDETHDMGYTPRTVKTDLGRNTKTSIQGGGVRAFRIRTSGTAVEEMPQAEPTPNFDRCALPLRNPVSLREAVLLRPTFFEHYNRATVDWKYIESHETTTLKDEGLWAQRIGLKLSVDLTTGINLFPDLRIVDNDHEEYQKSMDHIHRVIDKMQEMKADELILTSMRPIENNYTQHAFDSSLVVTCQNLADYAAKRGIHIVYHLEPFRVGSSIQEALKLTAAVARSNFELAPSLAMLLADGNHLNDDLKALRNYGVKRLFVSAPRRDINGDCYDYNLPLCKANNADDVKQILTRFPNAYYYMDGNYANFDEEYLDNRILTDNIK